MPFSVDSTEQSTSTALTVYPTRDTLGSAPSNRFPKQIEVPTKLLDHK